MRVLTVVGTRPEFVKAWAVSQALSNVADEILVHAGQHLDHEMSETFFAELRLDPPDIALRMQGSHPGLQLATLVEHLVPRLDHLRPDWVLVYGDTTTTLAGALAASFTGHRVAHVEAGLRSYAAMPEERNRVLVDRVASLLFCPSPVAVGNLLREGIAGDHVLVVGDVNLDALLAFEGRATVPPGLESEGPLVVLTVHREENADDPQRLRQILDGVEQAEQRTVWPVHPRTAKRLTFERIRIPANVSLLPPVSFLTFLGLLKAAQCVVTDSGGVQKEAYWLGVPCITVRNETEWIETVQNGWNVLVGDNQSALTAAIAHPPRGPTRPLLYGTGRAADQIVDELLKRC